MDELLATLPLLASGISLILGLVIGKKVAAKHHNDKLVWVAFAALLALIMFGGKVTSWLVSTLYAIGVSAVVAQYLGLVILCSFTGVVFAFALSKAHKAGTEKRD